MPLQQDGIKAYSCMRPAVASDRSYNMKNKSNDKKDISVSEEWEQVRVSSVNISDVLCTLTFLGPDAFRPTGLQLCRESACLCLCASVAVRTCVGESRCHFK